MYRMKQAISFLKGFRSRGILVLIVLTVLLAIIPAVAEEGETVEEIAPTCTKAGYTKITGADGSITVTEGEPPRGHSFGEWQVNEEGERFHSCMRCGLVETERETGSLPRVDLEGSFDGIGKKERIRLHFRYREEEKAFECTAYTSWQGHSSLTDEKKNYTIRLYADEALTEKNRMELRPGWQTEHKYVLKANYRDMSQCRNLVCAEIWAQMAASREGVPERLRNTSHYGAVDGFPVAVYHDGEFMGLYTMNLHKDDDLYAMRYGARECIMICNRTGTPAGQFRAEAAFATEEWEEGDWEVEYAGTETDDSWAKDALNELIHFVMTADDKTFREELGSYLDVNSAIDYLIFLYAMGLTESADKDLTLIRYEGTPWIATVYDMEDAFGLEHDGTDVKDADAFLPAKDGDSWTTGTGSLLWDRLMNAFAEEIRARYRELRGSVLTEENIREQVTGIMDRIPETLKEKDLELYPNRETVSRDREKILSYIQERLPLLDRALPEE